MITSGGNRIPPSGAARTPDVQHSAANRVSRTGDGIGQQSGSGAH